MLNWLIQRTNFTCEIHNKYVSTYVYVCVRVRVCILLARICVSADDTAAFGRWCLPLAAF